MLETVCGMRPVELQKLHKKVFLAELVFLCWKRANMFEVVDPRLEDKSMAHEVELVLTLGSLC